MTPMAKGENQKLKLLYLRDFLLETDEDHPITMEDILARLSALGVDAERKSIYTDMQALRMYGMDIELKKLGRSAAYYLKSRLFEPAELKTLVDSVQAAKFLSEKKSFKLIKKLASLSSRHEAELLNRQIYVQNRDKSQNETIFHSVDTIHSAIADNVQIRFRYWQYGVDKKPVYRHSGKNYMVSPYALIWDNENYYLIAYDSESGLCKHYRVDKMSGIAKTDLQRDGREVFGMLDLAVYTKRNFSMFAGEDAEVTLLCENRMIGVIIDRFGRSVSVTRQGSDSFIVRVKVSVSPQFFGWLSSLEGGVRLTAPAEVVEQYRAHLENLLHGL